MGTGSLEPMKVCSVVKNLSEMHENDNIFGFIASMCLYNTNFWLFLQQISQWNVNLNNSYYHIYSRHQNLNHTKTNVENSYKISYLMNILWKNQL